LSSGGWRLSAVLHSGAAQLQVPVAQIIFSGKKYPETASVCMDIMVRSQYITFAGRSVSFGCEAVGAFFCLRRVQSVALMLIKPDCW
jgi:hypothetical protein